MRVLLISLILFFFSVTPVFAHSAVQIIEITDQGFDPQTVTIDENMTIIFYNVDKEPHWPASNPHPTHDLYPDFDPKKPLQPKESWVFKPKKGEWRYHDHLSPHLRGILIVKPEPSPTLSVPSDMQTSATQEKKNILSQLQDKMGMLFQNIRAFFTPKKDKQAYKPPSGENFKKLSAEKQTQVIEAMGQENPKKAWQYLKDTYKNAQGTQGNVHDLAHLVGGLLYKNLGFTGLSSCSQEFGFGCYHGFLDKAFSTNLDHLLDAENACLQLDANKNVSGPVASCIHGIGHGIASYYLTADLPQSLQTCNKLTKGQQYCYDGVFMEFVRNAPEAFFHQDDPLYPCSQFGNQQDAYLLACGRNQPALLIDRFHKSFDEAAKVCQSADSPSLRQGCFDALGFLLAGSGDVNRVVSGCQGMPDFTKECMQAAAGEMVFQGIPGWFEKSHAVCIALPVASQPDCLHHVESIASDYNRKKT